MSEPTAPRTHKVSVQGTGPFHHRVIVDGVDLSRGLTGLSLRIGIGSVPELTLDVQLIDISELKDIEAKVLIAPATHDALVTLGWTPPEETSA
ncbi:hypothetical protein ACFO3J_24200 [Streptomyces polygonati]|uniref:Uncharacterized protein n=1 Tax=Streptomyces polygonati TaxID=1617087 RepID=A0ABV8HUJ1_9ACTN